MNNYENFPRPTWHLSLYALFLPILKRLLQFFRRTQQKKILFFDKVGHILTQLQKMHSFYLVVHIRVIYANFKGSRLIRKYAYVIFLFDYFGSSKHFWSSMRDQRLPLYGARIKELKFYANKSTQSIWSWPKPHIEGTQIANKIPTRSLVMRWTKSPQITLDDSWLECWTKKEERMKVELVPDP